MSDRVVVLSNRPATVQKIVDIDFGHLRTPESVRTDPRFQTYFNTIWKELT